MNHPEPEVLIRFADGEDIDPALVAHLRHCDECRASLTELGRFEASVALATPIQVGERQAMRAATERLLTLHARVSSRWRLVTLAVGLAAAALVLVSLWPSGRPACRVGVHRYEAAGSVRAARSERFQLTVQLQAPRWLALWRLDAPGRHVRLMPHADPLLRYLGTEMPLGPGEHRVPATELFDFEFTSDAVPTSLLLVPTAAELTVADFETIETLLASTPRDQLVATLTARHAEATLVPFPAR